MNNRQKWIARQLTLGWTFAIAGLITGFIGLFLPALVPNLPFSPRVITGLGILMLGVGTSYLVRSGTARRDPQAADRMISNERDERLQRIRSRAGNRAYWVSAVMIYIGLLWVSFSGTGGFQAPSPDGLWYFLAAVAVIPFGVYIASLFIDLERH